MANNDDNKLLWEKELLRRVKMDDNRDEKYADGVYDLSLELAEKLHRIFIENNTLNDIADAYFPDTEIACAIYDAIKYGKGV